MPVQLATKNEMQKKAPNS